MQSAWNIWSHHVQGEDCLFFRKDAFPQGRDPVGSHYLQDNALKTAVRSERCAANMVWTEEETSANMKENSFFSNLFFLFTKVQKEKNCKEYTINGSKYLSS